MKPSVLLELAHPDMRGFGGALADAFVQALKNRNCEGEQLHLQSMPFNATPVGRQPELEADLVRARKSIRQAKHILLIYSTWFGGILARMKGFFELVFGSDFAFKYKQDPLFPGSMLRGRSADVLLGVDTPPWLYGWVMGQPAIGWCAMRSRAHRAQADQNHYLRSST